METYDKEKLHEYAKELFMLCLEKNIALEYYSGDKEFCIYIEHETYKTFCTEGSFLAKKNSVFNEGYNVMPIWELIEKVKSL